jgi:hypothetical protein
MGHPIYSLIALQIKSGRIKRLGGLHEKIQLGFSIGARIFIGAAGFRWRHQEE